MSARAFTIGVDFGTSSVRALVVDCEDGRELGTRVFDYPSGDQGVLLDPKQPHLARQNPADYIEGLRESLRGALRDAERDPGFSRQLVVGIGVDTTGSTPLPVDADAHPLACDPRWKSNLAAHAWLWKDHTSAEEAARITEIAAAHAPEYLAPIGGTYSSEWWWSKIWHCLRTSPDVFDAAASWVELADFIPALLSGVSDASRSSAASARPATRPCTPMHGAGCRRRRFSPDSIRSWRSCATGSTTKRGRPAIPRAACRQEWALTLDLPAGIAIAMGGFDAHYGAVGSGVRTGTLVKIIGTSTCDCAVAPTADRISDIPGICGIVNGSILPGYFGIEAGQSAVGDILKWWVEGVCQRQQRAARRPVRGSGAARARRVGARRARLEQRQPHHPGGHAAHRTDPGTDPAHDPRGRSIVRSSRRPRTARARSSSE